MVARTVCLVAAGILLAASAAQATSLDLTPGLPDITAGFVTVNYDPNGAGAGRGRLTAHGFTNALDLDGLAPMDYSTANGKFVSSFFDVFVDLDPLTASPFTGGLTVQGKVPLLGATSGTLLTGTLSGFGFQNPPGGEIFEFLFSTSGGDLAPIFTPHVGVILDASSSGFNGMFNAAFSNWDDGVADTFAYIPEPLTVVGVLLGLIGGAGYLRRRLG